MKITKKYSRWAAVGAPLQNAAIYQSDVEGRAALVDAGGGQAQDRLLADIRSCGLA